MNDPVWRVRRGACIFAAIFIVAVLGYRFGAGYTWLASVWMVVVTISSVGFGEESVKDPGFQLFTIAVIVIGMSAAAYTFGGFVQVLVGGELASALGNNRMKREIGQLRNHVILCGFGRMGQELSDSLERMKMPYVVIDKDAPNQEEQQVDDCLRLIGDATEEELLQQAGLEHARAIVSSIPNDAENVFITLTAREQNRDILIVTRAEHPSTEKKLRQAGADRVVMPTIVGAHQMARTITKPTTADLLNLMSDAQLDVELDELMVPENSPLVGMDVRESEAHRTHKLLVVAIKNADQKMVFNPPADYVVQLEDILLVMGHAEDIETFRRRYVL